MNWWFWIQVCIINLITSINSFRISSLLWSVHLHRCHYLAGINIQIALSIVSSLTKVFLNLFAKIIGRIFLKAWNIINQKSIKTMQIIVIWCVNYFSTLILKEVKSKFLHIEDVLVWPSSECEKCDDSSIRTMKFVPRWRSNIRSIANLQICILIYFLLPHFGHNLSWSKYVEESTSSASIALFCTFLSTKVLNFISFHFATRSLQTSICQSLNIDVVVDLMILNLP